MRVTTSAKWKRFFTSLIIFFLMITIASLFAILMSCRPIGLLWDPLLEGHCDVRERTIVIYIQGGTFLFHSFLGHEFVDSDEEFSHGCWLRCHTRYFTDLSIVESADQQLYKDTAMWLTRTWIFVSGPHPALCWGYVTKTCVAQVQPAFSEQYTPLNPHVKTTLLVSIIQTDFLGCPSSQIWTRCCDEFLSMEDVSDLFESNQA